MVLPEQLGNVRLTQDLTFTKREIEGKCVKKPEYLFFVRCSIVRARIHYLFKGICCEDVYWRNNNLYTALKNPLVRFFVSLISPESYTADNSVGSIFRRND